MFSSDDEDEARRWRCGPVVFCKYGYFRLERHRTHRGHTAKAIPTTALIRGIL
jgi:hypothetical protein